MNKELSIFGCLLLISALFSVVMVPQSVNAADNVTSQDRQHPSTSMLDHQRSSTPIACPTSYEWRVQGGHAGVYTPYNCGDKMTIREAVDAMEGSEIYHNNTERNGFLVRFTGKLIFPNGVAEHPEKSNSILNRFANVLSHYDNKVDVLGYASDPDISTSQYPSNQELSEARAKSVANHLIYSNGISADRLSVKGFGERQDRFLNSKEITDARRERLNRRVDFFIRN